MELVCRCLLVCCLPFDNKYKKVEEEAAPAEGDEENIEALPLAQKPQEQNFQSYNPREEFEQPDSHAIEEQEDKMNLIGNAAANTKIVAAANTRNQQKNRFNGGNTNGITESPSMEIEMQQLATGNLPNTPAQRRR